MTGALRGRRVVISGPVGVALLLVAGYGSPATAAPHGGSGGSPFNASCGSNAVLVGAVVRTNTTGVVHGITPVCVKVKSDGKWDGAPFGIGVFGGSGGKATESYCANHTAVSGIVGKSGTLVDRLSFNCSALTVESGQIKTTGGATPTAMEGGGGGSPFTDNCASGQVVLGLPGRSGSLLDQIDRTCGNFAAPSVPPMTVTLTADPAQGSSLASCTSNVKFTAATQGGPSGTTTYKFSVLRANNPEVQESPFGSDAVRNWPSVGAGTHKVWVTARRAGTPDARSADLSYSVPLPITFAQSPPSPASGPTAVTLTTTSSASCLPLNTTLKYTWWVDGTISPIQDSNTWTTAQLSAGTHTLTARVAAARSDGSMVTSSLKQTSYVVGGVDQAIWDVSRHIRCVNCHGRVDPVGGRNHSATSTDCTACHSNSAVSPDWKNTNVPSFWAGSGNATTAKSASEICNTVKSSSIGSNRTSLLHHVGTDVNGTADSNPDKLIKWGWNPVAPVGTPTGPVGTPSGGVTGMSYSDWGKKMMQWFDAGKPCP